MFLLAVLTTELLFKGYQPKFQDRNQRDEEGEIDLKSFDERGSRWKKLSKHKRLLRSCSFAFCPPCHSPRFVKRTHSAVSVMLSLWATNPNWCCSRFHVQRCMLVSFYLVVFTPFLVCRRRCVQTVDQHQQQIPHQTSNIERCEKWWKEKENK